MPEAPNIFLIDSTRFLEASQRSFLGAPLLVVDGENHIFLFGVIRDLLRLRQKLGINQGVVVVGEEAHQITTDANIEKTVAFLKQVGITVVHDSHVHLLDLCVGLASLVTHVVTQDQSLLQFAKDGRRVILFDKEAIDVFTCETVISRFGVTPDSVPAFLALTSGPEHAVLTKREAIAVLQQPGDLADKIDDPAVVSSRKIRSKFKANGDAFLRRLKQLSPSGRYPCLDVNREQLRIEIDNDDNGPLLATHAFHSLKRLLQRPAEVPLVPQEVNLGSPNFHVIKNPPWEIWNPKTIEFFTQYFTDFSSLSNQDAKAKQHELSQVSEIASAWSHYQAGFYESSLFFQNNEDYANQDIQPPGSNLYGLFLERAFRLLNNGSCAGLIVPDGFYCSSATKALRQLFLRECQIDSLYCFENRYPTVFNGVTGAQKFITIVFQKKSGGRAFRCAFMQHDPSRLPAIEATAILMKPEHVARFSPDSLGITEFNTQRDLDIAEKLYCNYPLLGETVAKLWNFPLLSVEFNMTHQSAMFRYSGGGYPLYEGKMMNQFDHLFAEGRIVIETKDADKYILSKELHRMGRTSALGTLVRCGEVKPRSPLSRYRFGVRSIARSIDQRALITTVLPQNVCVGNSLFTAIPWNYRDANPRPKDEAGWYTDHFNGSHLLFVVAVLNSFPYDWLTRMKISTNVNVFILNQLPMPRLGDGNANDSAYFWPIVARALRLICTTEIYAALWAEVFSKVPRATLAALCTAPAAYGPAHEQNLRIRRASDADTFRAVWTPGCGLHERTAKRRDTGDRAQTRAEIDALVAHLYGLTREEFAYILDTFPVLRRKEVVAFGEYQSKRKALEEYDRFQKEGYGLASVRSVTPLPAKLERTSRTLMHR